MELILLTMLAMVPVLAVFTIVVER